MNFLLDTCVISELVKPRPEPGVIRWIEALPEERLYLSALVLGELHKGVARLEDGARKTRLAAWLEVDICARFEGRILVFDAKSAQTWGQICGAWERRGRTWPLMDSLLAASALAYGMTLVTHNIQDVQALGCLVHNPWPAATE